MSENSKKKFELRMRRKNRVRSKIFGTPKSPRLTVFRSLKNISVQIIDDTKHSVLASASSREIDSSGKKMTKTESAGEVGKLIASKAKELKIEKVVFDRSSYRYHGRVKALAEGAREKGLNF